MQHVRDHGESEENDKLILNLTRTPAGDVHVRSVEVLDRVSRVRFSFKAGATLRDVFTAQANEVLHALVDRVADLRALTLPDFVAQLQDLLLRGARLLCTEATEAGSSIMIRFKRFFGRVRSLFSGKVGQRDAFDDEAVDFAVQAIERAYLPLQNFGRYIDDLMQYEPETLDSKSRAFLQRIRREIDDLSYSSDLAILFVNGTKPERASLSSEKRDMQTLRSGRFDRPDEPAVIPRPLISNGAGGG